MVTENYGTPVTKIAEIIKKIKEIGPDSILLVRDDNLYIMHHEYLLNNETEFKFQEQVQTDDGVFYRYLAVGEPFTPDEVNISHRFEVKDGKIVTDAYIDRDFGAELATLCEEAFITEKGGCNYDNMAKLKSMLPECRIEIFAVEQDSFGWVIGCLSFTVNNGKTSKRLRVCYG